MTASPSLEISRHMRPAAPPPYPGRSVILNYDIDDPQHWKNKLDKKLQVAGQKRTLMKAPADCGQLAARKPSPVAAGAVLTLAELKRKQMNKRLAKLAASGSVSSGTADEESNEEDVDSAEASLELKLHGLIAKEYERAPLIGVDSNSLSPGPDVARQPRPSQRITPSSPTNEPAQHRHAVDSRRQLPTTESNYSRRTPRAITPNDSKFHFYGPKSPTIPARLSSGRRFLTAMEFEETFDGERGPTPLLPPTGRSKSHQVNNSNYRPATPPLPPLSSENSPVESPTEAGTGFWDGAALREETEHVVTDRVGECDLDSTGGEQRASSSDEGFGGNFHREDGGSPEDFARKQVLMMYEVQLQMLKMLGGENRKHQQLADNNFPITGRVPVCHTLPRSASFSGYYEHDMQQRCEFLEDHIATLARNIEHLTEEIHSQQTTLRYLQRDRRPKVRFVESVPFRPESQMDKATDSQNRPNTVSPIRTPPPTSEAVSFSNPERLSKLTKFFGTEPPLVRLFLRKLGYEKYATLFEIEKIGFNELPYMTDDRLRKLGIPMGPRIRILREAQSAMKLDRDPNVSTSGSEWM